MFTAKIINQEGVEFGREITSWIYTPSPLKEPQNNPEQTPNVTLFLAQHPAGNVETIYSGSVFIMNENGKTVANYHIEKRMTEENK